MDFIAHVGVKVTLGHAMSCMGWLYANTAVLPEWLLFLEQTEAEATEAEGKEAEAMEAKNSSLKTLVMAETRGWIFQEGAFGPLDQ